MVVVCDFVFFVTSTRRHTSYIGDWSSDVCSSDLSSVRTRCSTSSSPARADHGGGEELVEHLVRTLLRRWGVVFWRLLAREAEWLPPWRDLLRSEERRVGKERRAGVADRAYARSGW